ncbi:hypothetical protein BOX15_Mlig006544g2, partial [Macrostomum lignano]
WNEHEMDEGPIPEVAAYIIIRSRRPIEEMQQSDGGERREIESEAVEAAGSQAASGSINIGNSQGVGNLCATRSGSDAAEASPSAAMAAAATPNSAASSTSATAQASATGSTALLNRTNSERLGQKPNQRKTFQEILSIRNEDRRVTETVLSENTEFETLGLEEYSLSSGKSLLESVQQHRDSRSAHVRHHEEVSSVDIWRKRVEHVYKSTFRMPDGSSVAVTHEEAYHTTDPNVEVTVCLAQALPSADCRPGRANVADLAESNKWASLILSCDGFRDDQLCSMLLKKDGEHGAEAAAEAAAVASSVAAVVSATAAADPSPPVVDLSLSSEITLPLPTAYVALYGEDESVSSDSAESVVENVTSAEAKNKASQPSKLAPTYPASKSKSSIGATFGEFQSQTEFTQKSSPEAENTVSDEHSKSIESSVSKDISDRVQRENLDAKAEPKESKAPKKLVKPDESPKESHQSKKSVDQKRNRRRLNRILDKNEASSVHSEGNETASGGAAVAIETDLQKRMEAFLDSKRTKSEKPRNLQEPQSTQLESNATMLEEVSVATTDSLSVFCPPKQSARLSVSEKMCMEVLAEPYYSDESDSNDEKSTRPRGFYSYLYDGPKNRMEEDEIFIKVFQRTVTTDRRLTQGEILTVEFSSDVADSESVSNVSLNTERGEKSHSNSRYHTVYVRDPAANSYVKIHEPIYDDVSPRGSKAPSEASSDNGSIDESAATTLEPLRNTANQYLDNPLSPFSPASQQSGSDQVDMRTSQTTTATDSTPATITTTPTSQKVAQLTVVTTNTSTNEDSGTADEKFSPGIVKRRAEQYEVRRAMRKQTAEERKSYQELVNSGIVKVKRKEHEDLIEKDALPPSPSDFRFEVEPDQLERVVYQKEQSSTASSTHPSAPSPKEASVVAPIIRQMEKEAVFEFQPAKSSSNQKSRPTKKVSDPTPVKTPASDSSKAKSTSEQVTPVQTEQGERYPAQDNRSPVLPIEKPSTETAVDADEPQPFSPRLVKNEAMLHYDRSQENRSYFISDSELGRRTEEERLLKTQTSEEQGKWLYPDAVGKSETLRYDRAQENLLPSTASGEKEQVEQLKGNDLHEDAELKISTLSERYESKRLPAAVTGSIVSATSEDSSQSSAESDGSGDYDTGYEKQYELQEVLKKVKSKPPKEQKTPQKPPPHEVLPTSLASLKEAEDERESEENSSSEGSPSVVVDEGSLSDQQLFFSTGHIDQQPPISILIADENSISSLLVQEGTSESASSESDDDDDDEDEDYSETVRAASGWYQSHPVEDMYLPRRHILATIDEETVSQASTSINSQSTDVEVTVPSRQSDLSNQDTILVRPPSPKKSISEAPIVAEEDDLSGSGASDNDKTIKPKSRFSHEAEEDIAVPKITSSSQYRSAVKLPAVTQIEKVAQTDSQLILGQDTYAKTAQLISTDNFVTVSEDSTTEQESNLISKVLTQSKSKASSADPAEPPTVASADSDNK